MCNNLYFSLLYGKIIHVIKGRNHTLLFIEVFPPKDDNKEAKLHILFSRLKTQENDSEIRLVLKLLSKTISCSTFTFPVVTQDTKACTILSSHTGSP